MIDESEGSHLGKAADQASEAAAQAGKASDLAQQASVEAQQAAQKAEQVVENIRAESDFEYSSPESIDPPDNMSLPGESSVTRPDY